jgi:hypothetical protein
MKMTDRFVCEVKAELKRWNLYQKDLLKRINEDGEKSISMPKLNAVLNQRWQDNELLIRIDKALKKIVIEAMQLELNLGGGI